MRTWINEYKDVGNGKQVTYAIPYLRGRSSALFGDARGLRRESILPKPQKILVRVGINEWIGREIRLWMGS